VSSLVVLHVAFGPKTLPTPLRTGEGSFVGVNQHMNAQVLLLGEVFPAAGFRTLEGLGIHLLRFIRDFFYASDALDAHLPTDLVKVRLVILLTVHHLKEFLIYLR